MYLLDNRNLSTKVLEELLIELLDRVFDFDLIRMYAIHRQEVSEITEDLGIIHIDQ